MKYPVKMDSWMVKEVAEIFSTLQTPSMSTGQGTMRTEWYHSYTIVESFCDLFEKHILDFNKTKFLEASGYEPWDKVVMGMPMEDEDEISDKM